MVYLRTIWATAGEHIININLVGAHLARCKALRDNMPFLGNMARSKYKILSGLVGSLSGWIVELWKANKHIFSLIIIPC